MIKINLSRQVPNLPTKPQTNPPVTQTIFPPAPVLRAIPKINIKSIISQIQNQTDGDAHNNFVELAVEKKITDFEKSPYQAAAKENKPQLSKVSVGDIQLDPSQISAVQNLRKFRFGCLTGSAGTGKTTVTKFLVDSVIEEVGTVALHTYWGNKENDDGTFPADYELKFVPSICLCAPTGKASQMIKKNFPPDWKDNIMTIHRMLGYFPSFFEDTVDGITSSKMEWNPRYTMSNKMPWDIIFIDEAGMVPLLLWEQIIAAARPSCRIYFIGDINQLPPPYGQPIFPFAMSRYPTFELTEIHRQKGENNSIVENAWRVIHGQKPISDNPANKDWKFLMAELSADPNIASLQFRAWITKFKGIVYEPLRDIIITPINGDKEDAAGIQLGRMLLNDYFSAIFIDNSERYKIDAGRDVKLFAINDRVMVTKNDYEKQVTNGMIGVIKSIRPNGVWRGPWG